MEGSRAKAKKGQLVPQSFPPGSWLRLYLDNVVNVTEAPWMFHVLGGLAALGGAWGRNLRIPWADYNIYGNMSVLWLGPSGCGKTQAFDVALDTLKMARPDLCVIKNEATPVGIIRRIGGDLEQHAEAVEHFATEDSEFVFAAGEMSTIINKKKDSDGILPMLTDMMDCKVSYERTTVVRGVDYVHNPTPTALMCSTEEWVHGMMPAGIFEGGFMSRIIPVVAKGKARALAIPRILSDTERRVPGLALKRLLQAHPKLRFELDAIVLKHYSLWYTQLHSTTPDDRRLMGWQARLHGHLLKIAALLALSASWQRLGKEHPQISLGHLMFASRILAEIHPGLVALVTSSSATNFGAVRQKVMVAVSRAKREGLTRGALLASVHVRPRELDETLESLVGAKEVTVVAGTPGHPEARYRHAKYRR